MPHWQATLFAIGLGVALFAAMLLFLEMGRHLGMRHAARRGDAAREGAGKADAPVYALLGLLIGFTFSGAGARFDHRRELVSQQVNAISTGWQRIDALPPEAQPPVRAGFRGYVDALLAVYRTTPSRAEALADPATVARWRDDLWTHAVAACLTDRGEKARMLLLPAINEMFDVADTERLARRIHPPLLIYVMLGIAALAGALFAGYGLAAAPGRNWLYMVGISATVASALFVIIELEYPRRGLVRVDAMDAALTELRATMQ